MTQMTTNCALCNLRAAAYNQPLRWYDGVLLCLGCFLELHGVSFGDPGVDVLRPTFLTDLAGPESQQAA